jgi:hypothetical protein
MSADPAKAVMEDPVLMEKHLKEAMKRSKDELKLTKEEEDRLTNAFKEPEFKKLMGEYLQGKYKYCLAMLCLTHAIYTS